MRDEVEELVSGLSLGEVNTSPDGRPVLDVRINDSPVPTLFDTGANVSVLSWTAYKGLRNQPVLVRSTRGVRAANGEPLHVMGRAVVDLEWNDIHCRHLMFVIRGITSAAIIGTDIMTKEDLVVDPGRKSAVRRPVPEAPVVARRAVVVDAWSERTVSCIIRSERPLAGRHVTVNPLPDCPVIEALHTVQPDERISVVLCNDSDLPLVVKRGEMVATCSPSDEFILCDDVTVSALLVSELTSREGKTGKGPGHRRRISEGDLKLDSVPPEYREKYLELFKKFSDVFSLDPDDVGECDLVKQKITLKDQSKITCVPPYRTPHHLIPVLRAYVEKLAARGIIRRSTSPFCSPTLLVKKANADPSKPLVEQYRVVHDYRALNANVVRDAYPLQQLYELIDKVASSPVKTVIDLANGFFNQCLDEASRAYTAFGLPGIGHFEYTRSAQGLCNSPSAFQRLLDNITAGLTGVRVYIDDVIICSASHAEHLLDLEKLFTRFRRFRMKCRLSKVQLASTEINYLGYNIGRHGVRAGAAKTEAIRNWTAPNSVTQVKQFIGLASFFRRTIEDFASRAQPLTRLTREDSGWRKGDLPPAAAAAFRDLQSALCKRPCLAPVNFKREFILTVDASKVGLGAVLSQVGPDMKEHPCAYASRTLNEQEEKWASFHLEYLAMVWACRHFKPYLVGRHFTLRTDHKPLVAMNKVRTQGLERLQAELHGYLPFTVTHIPGKDMPADGLSRAPHAVSPLELVQFTWEQVRHMQQQDFLVKALACWLKFGLTPDDPHHLRFVRSMQQTAHLRNGVVCIRSPTGRSLVVAPVLLRHNILHQCHEVAIAGHYGADKTLAKVLDRWYWPTVRRDVQNFVRNCPRCTACNNPGHKRPSPLEPLEPATHFNARVHLDLLQMPADEGCSYLLVLTDAYSKLVSAVPLADKQAETVARATFAGWISVHGAPERFISDHGREFDCAVFKELCSYLGIDHRLCSPAHPRSNGQVERCNRTFLQYVRKFAQDNHWVPLVPSFVLSYNTTVQSSIKRTPYFAAFGRLPNLPPFVRAPPMLDRTASAFSAQLRAHDELSRLITKAQKEAFLSQKAEFDKRARSKSFRVGDRVFASRPRTGGQAQKLQDQWYGPFMVLDVCPHNNYKISGGARRHPVVLHADRLKLAPYMDQIYNKRVELPLGMDERGTDSPLRAPRPASPRSQVPDDDVGPIPLVCPPPVVAQEAPSQGQVANAPPLSPQGQGSASPSQDSSASSRSSPLQGRKSAFASRSSVAFPAGGADALPSAQEARNARMGPSMPAAAARAASGAGQVLTRLRSRATGEKPEERPLPPRGGSRRRKPPDPDV